MKKILMLLFISLNSYSQLPLTEEFNIGTTWSFTNGSGIQYYGGTERYASTNLGTTPYPNSSTITITSPIYNFTTCTSNITISFPLSGNIQSGIDIMSFQYWNGISWITQQSFTGIQNSIFSYSLSNLITRFRFMLITDASINTFMTFPPPATNVYYYDIKNFKVTCNTVLPIELIEFTAIQQECIDRISWVTASEINNDYFELERSLDGINYKVITKITSTNSFSRVKYLFYDKESFNDIVYYRLKQTDYDSKSTYSSIISVNNRCYNENYSKIINVLGQEVTEDYRGTKLYIYPNKVIKKNE